MRLVRPLRRTAVGQGRAGKLPACLARAGGLLDCGSPPEVIHSSTPMFIHSCTVNDQHVCLNDPQAYAQDASLARPGLA